MKLIDLYHNHYAPSRLITANKTTKDRFQFDIRRFSEFLGHAATSDDLQTNLVSALLSAMLAKGLAMETVAGTRKKLVALWRFAHQKRLCESYPDVQPIPEERDPPIAWTEDEVLRLLEACRNQKGTICGVPAHLWWHALHMVLLDTGARIGATLKVEWSAVNLERGTMLFAARTQKNRRGQIHKLRPETVEDLRLMLEPRRQLVWPYPGHMVSLYYRYAKLLEQAGLPADHKCKFHKLRKTVATWFESKGGNATELLGHASRKHTKDSYLDESQIERPTPASLLPAMNQPISDRREPLTELERLLEAFLDREQAIIHRGAETASPQTRKALRSAATKFFRLSGATAANDLTGTAIEAALKGLKDGLAASTVTLYSGQFLRFLRWLDSEGHEVKAAIAVLESDWRERQGAA